LFNAKASSWETKYGPQGPLSHRIDIFGGLLAEQVQAGAAVLDFGCGTGTIARALVQRGFKLTACDVSEQMIVHGKGLCPGTDISWHCLPEGWRRFPFGDSSFDAIVASSVFEYLQGVDDVLTECSRILRVGGKLIISVPNPQHFSRKLEHAIGQVAELGCRMPGIRHLPKIGSYFVYLRVSRSRFSKHEWQQKALDAGLRPLDLERGKSNARATEPMMYLGFER
jgi:2-polyprenyl-3-methyl-5-hydroxy-6-metoxy-1,4-benzoquinol methylase